MQLLAYMLGLSARTSVNRSSRRSPRSIRARRGVCGTSTTPTTPTILRSDEFLLRVKPRRHRGSGLPAAARQQTTSAARRWRSMLSKTRTGAFGKRELHDNAEQAEINLLLDHVKSMIAHAGRRPDGGQGGNYASTAWEIRRPRFSARAAITAACAGLIRRVNSYLTRSMQ